MKKSTQCPVCTNQTFSKHFTAAHTHGKNALSQQESFMYARCSRCQSIILQNVTFNPDYYKKYYDFSEMAEATGLLKMAEGIIAWYSQRRKRRVLGSYKGKPKKRISVLDVGCGRGDFLNNLGVQFEAYGIELDKKEFAISKKKGLQVFNEDILTKDFSGKTFDIITLWHVVEHIPDPRKLFDRLESLLNPEGIIIIATPNIDSLGFHISQTNWFHFDAPRHVILFNKVGIGKLAEKYGLRVEEVICETFEFPLDLFWSLKNSSHAFRYIYLLFYPLVKLRAQETLTYILTKKM